jgi:hypothetical protein
MMKKNDYNSQIVSSEKLQEYSQHFADTFLKRAICYQPRVSDIVDFSFYPTREEYEAESKRCVAGPIFSEKQENGCKVHLCEECLKDIPSLALRGWLEQELAFCRQKRQEEEFYCNFRELFLPLFYVVGIAENHIRELVHHLESGLKRYFATERVLNLGFGLHQVYFYFFKLDPGELPEERYQATVPHPWMRSHFLSKKLKDLMPISLLARRNIYFSRELEENWWKYHEYFISEDKLMLKKIVAIPERHVNESFCFKLVEIFKIVKAHLLEPPVKSLASNMIH